MDSQLLAELPSLIRALRVAYKPKAVWAVRPIVSSDRRRMRRLARRTGEPFGVQFDSGRRFYVWPRGVRWSHG
jgi:hypothetical protein